MHSLNVLLLAAVVACAVPRPLGSSTGSSMSQLPRRLGRQEIPFLRNFVTPRQLMQKSIFMYEDSPRAMVPSDALEPDWLNKEIDRINRMDDNEAISPFEMEYSSWIPQENYVPRPYEHVGARDPVFIPKIIAPVSEEMHPVPSPRENISPKSKPEPSEMPVRFHKTSTQKPIDTADLEAKRKTFALTPLDKGYYENRDTVVAPKSDGPHEGGESKTSNTENPMAFQPLRQTRQNPNLGRTKNLIAEDLDRLRIGLTQEHGDGTEKPHHIHVLESTPDPAESIYGIALIAAVGTALTIAVFGFAFGWYTLSKKAKAAADVDYPAYGVTGPTIDTSGDRKLAHSAHMYHYQHQKQQIIAMERNGMDHRNGSVSDPESEEENEEGDYTVYECPGFATTGDMEVKNPLFSENPTPATPGKCELVKPQPKD